MMKIKGKHKPLKIICIVLAVIIAFPLSVFAAISVKSAVQVKQLEKLTMKDSPTVKYAQLMPDTEKIYSWATDLVNMGARKPGTPAWQKANAYVTDKLTSFGLQEVKTIESETTMWSCSSNSLRVAGEEIPSYYMTHSFNDGSFGTFNTPEGGLNADIVYVGDGDESDFKNIDVKGKIVIADIRFSNIPLGLSKLISYLYYDPDHSIGLTDLKKNPYSANTYPYNYYNAMENGAVGFIGILSDYIDSNQFNNEDYSYMGDHMKLPGLWVSKSDGERVINLINSGKNNASINMCVTIERVKAGAVVGMLPGKSEETIIVQSHYDSATPGGVEDASGTADVLALAKFYSQISANERQKNLLFILMDTHFSDYDTHDAVIAEYLGENHKILADVCIEHIAAEMKTDDSGNAVMTDETEPRLLFMNDIKALRKITQEEIVRHKLKKTIILPTWIFDEVPTDADMIYQQGVPIISMITAPIYLYDNMDTADKIAKDELKPVAETFADIIWRLTELPAE